ncbi:DNA-binding transcriptional regulator, FrmR family [Caldanaerobius fijiensis DSM 17918]|uniref:DNA-binding transcriptional regulator, FrmR family n=1 Tax=Caldanaerobius fijiensis DSM 17918 TaxID=1121256 RepID=A0A1M4TZJ7_9THEO|nr:metal-sensitive transcriptional regulator [Caldanaerobius fijiensis]SHE49813.1 DNA-binding transcriptional regulator, FrmR family [Caldanaerobius fijiensis DSM 17918]
MSVSYSEQKDDLIKRLKKIEGQIKGIQKMIEEEKYCVDVLVQIAAVRSAINKVGSIILKSHAMGCVVNSVDESDRKEKVDELVETFIKFMK